jgi:undecaprenyl-diphosphatase
MNYIKKHDFKVFGVYRILIGIVVLVLGLTGVISVAL